jgi:hypothetical protein
MSDFRRHGWGLAETYRCSPDSRVRTASRFFSAQYRPPPTGYSSAPDSAAPGRKKKPNARVFWIDVVSGPLRLPVRLGGLASESALHLASHDCAAVHLIRSPTEHWTRPQRASPPLARGPPSAGRYFVFGIISIDSAVLPTESFPV